VVWVERRREARRRKADTELKTKTPHVNVGNYWTNPKGIEMKVARLSNGSEFLRLDQN
jgi:hypothetical protein